MKSIALGCLIPFLGCAWSIAADDEPRSARDVADAGTRVRHNRVEPPKTLTRARECAHSVVFSPDGRWTALAGFVAPRKWSVSSRPDGGTMPCVTVWSTESWQRFDLETPAGLPCIAAAFTPESDVLCVLTGDHQLRCYQLRSQGVARRKEWILRKNLSFADLYQISFARGFEFRAPIVHSPFSFSSDGAKLLVTTMHTTNRTGVGADQKSMCRVDIRDFRTMLAADSTEPGVTIAHSGTKVTGAGFLSGGKRLATLTEDSRTVQIWDCETGEKCSGFRWDARIPETRQKRFDAETGGNLKASDDGALIAISAKKLLALYRPDGTCVSYSWNELCSVGDPVFHPSGRWIAAMGAELAVGPRNKPRLFIWSVPDLQLVAKVDWTRWAGAARMSFSPDGVRVLADGYDVRLWDFADLLAQGGVTLDLTAPAIAELPD